MTTTNIGNTNLRAAALLAAMMIVAPLGCAAGAGKKVGDQSRWTLDFRVGLEQPEGKQPVEVRLGGELISTISAARSGEYDAQIQIAGARVSGNGAGVDGIGSERPGASEELRRRIERRFWATYREDGALLAVHFYRDVDPSDCNLLQMILTETQLVHPVSAEPVWTIVERDGAGSYLAIYQHAESNVVMKRKLKYLESGGAAGASPGALRVALDGSELRFALDPEGEVAGIDGGDRVRIGMPVQNAEQLSASTEVHLSNFRRGRAPGLIGSLANALPEVVSSPVITHQSDPDVELRRHDERLLEGRNTESVLQSAFSGEIDETLPDRLAALFRRHPEAAGMALALLQKQGPQTRLTDALGSASSPAATETLARLANDGSVSSRLRVDALTGLATTQHPSVESMRIPVGLLDDADARVASAARLMAGALARAGRAEHPAEADAIDTALIERYRKAGDLRDLSDLLAGLGNSASPSASVVIEEALRDPRAPVRAVAVRALRLALGPEVDGLLSAAITTDSDPSVRVGAIFAAGFRHPVSPILGEAVLRAARTDPADSVRSSAITLLARTPAGSPQIAETLAWIAANDAKPGLRRQARQAMERGVLNR